VSPGEIVSAFIGRVEDGDLDGALELLADDVVYDNVPMAPIHGRDGVRAALGPFLAAATEVVWTVFRQTETGPIVMNERNDRFVLPDKTIDIAVAGVFEVHGGVITLWRDYFDLGTFQAQLAG
jgi:limonene-1,2-epoxide hydrolase